MIGSRVRIVRMIRVLPLALVVACSGLSAAPPQRDISSREARRAGEQRQQEAQEQAKRAQREAKQRHKEVTREIKRRDKERRRETEQFTSSRRKQGEQVEARAGQPQQPAAAPNSDGPSRDQPSPIERLRGYSSGESKQ